MSDNPTTPPTQGILLWDANWEVMHDGKSAFEVSFVLETEADAEAWKRWLSQVAPGKDGVK
jgi:hypothetical protein